MLSALFRFNHRCIAHISDKRKPHCCNGCGTIQTAFFLHLLNDMLNHFLFILIQLQFFHNSGITFCQLAGCKSNRNIRFFRMIFNQMHDSVKTSVYSAALLIFTAKVCSPWLFLIFCHMNRMTYQLVDTFIFSCRYGNDRYSQHFFHLIHQDRTAIFPHFIHHIQCQNHGDIQFHQLHGEIQISFNIRRIHNINDSLGMLIQHKLTSHNFLTGIR